MLNMSEAATKAALAIEAAEEATQKLETQFSEQIASHRAKTQALTVVVDKLRRSDPKAQKISLLGDEVEGYAIIMRKMPDMLRDCGVNEKLKVEEFLGLIQKMFGTPGR